METTIVVEDGWQVRVFSAGPLLLKREGKVVVEKICYSRLLRPGGEGRVASVKEGVSVAQFPCALWLLPERRGRVAGGVVLGCF